MKFLEEQRGVTETPSQKPVIIPFDLAFNGSPLFLFTFDFDNGEQSLPPVQLAVQALLRLTKNAARTGLFERQIDGSYTLSGGYDGTSSPLNGWTGIFVGDDCIHVTRQQIIEYLAAMREHQGQCQAAFQSNAPPALIAPSFKQLQPELA